MKSKLLLMTFAISIAIALQLKAQTPGWTPSNTGFPNPAAGGAEGIFNISMVDVNTLWLTDYDGSGGGANFTDWTRTTNGGQSWTGGTVTEAIGLSAANIFGLDSNTAFYMFFDPTNVNPPAVYKTADAGTTWSLVGGVYTKATEFPDWGTFFDAQNGVMLGDPVTANGNNFQIYTTSDAGVTWTPVSNLPPPVNDGEGGLTSAFSRVGTTVWCGTTDGRVLRSTNMGHTWKAFTVPGFGSFGPGAGSLAAKDSNTCVVSINDVSNGADDGTYMTTDGGNTWTSIIDPGASTGWISSHGSIAYVPGGDSDVWVLAGGDPAVTARRGTVYTKDFVTYTTMDTFQHTVTLFGSPTKGYSGNFQENIGDTLFGGGLWIFTGSFPGLTAVQSPVFDNNSLSVHPNPASSHFTFNLKIYKPAALQVRLLNSMGEIVSSFVNPTAYGIVVHDFDTQNLAKGLYFLQVQVGKFQSSRKVIIQ